jgi:hypothetical protein
MMRGKWLVVSVLLLGLLLGTVAGLVLAQGSKPAGAAAPQALASTDFGYHGKLNRDNSPYDGTYGLRSSLSELYLNGNIQRLAITGLQQPSPVWSKTVNGVEWYPDMLVTLEMSDRL